MPLRVVVKVSSADVFHSPYSSRAENDAPRTQISIFRTKPASVPLRECLEEKIWGLLFLVGSRFTTGLKVAVCAFNIIVDALGLVQPSKS